MEAVPGVAGEVDADAPDEHAVFESVGRAFLAAGRSKDKSVVATF